MKSILLIVLPLFWCVYTSAQIKTVPSKSLVANGSIIKYDSLSNFVGNNVDSYINQTFYLPKTTGYEKKHGYQGFKKNLKGDVYQPVGSPKLTKYESVAGKYFEVVAIRRDTKAYKGDVYLELKESESGKILFFDYKKDFDTSFPFIVVGYYEKMKKTLLGNTFLLDMESPFLRNIDEIDTENAYIYDRYMDFKCVDYIVKEGFCWQEFLLLENKNHSKIELNVSDFKLIKDISQSDYLGTKALYENEQQQIEKQNRYYEKEKGIIEKSMLEAKKILGKTIYNYTNIVYSSENEDLVLIDKYIPLKVVSVEYGDKFYPVKIFLDDFHGHKYYKKITFDESSYSQYEFKYLFSLSDIRKQYPHISERRWNLIKKGEVCIGMTEEECELSLGEPNDVNKTTGSWGIHMQWVYDDSYLYFENGILKSIQN